MTDGVLRQVRHYLEQRFGRVGLPSPRSGDEWAAWLHRFRRSHSLLAALEQSAQHECIHVLDAHGTTLYASPASLGAAHTVCAHC